MEFRQFVAYHGPNRWAGVPTLEVLVDFGSRAAWTSRDQMSVVERLLTWLPMLDDPPQHPTVDHDDAGLHGSIRKRAVRGLPIGRVLKLVACALATAAGTPAHFSGTAAGDSPQTLRLLMSYEEESLLLGILETARQCVLAALDDQPFDAPIEIRKLVDLADDERLGPSSRAILRAAAARGIPCRRLNSGSLVQLGEGAKQHRIWTAETDETGSIGEDIAQDKALTKLLLRQVGVPVPQGRIAQTSEEACQVARAIGFPVVVKPRDANHGRGISFDLRTCDGISEAFDHAFRENKPGTTGVIVEQFAQGASHRLLVVGDRLIAAIRGQRDVVIGNGHSTIAELIDEANRDPRRGENYTDKLDTMNLNEAARLRLERQGLTRESVPVDGQEIIVTFNGDLTTDETSEVHPAVAERAVLAAQTVGLNIAGLDVIAEDIGRPLEDQGGVIIEVNAGPSLSMHVEPLYGQPQPVGDAIVELMFPGVGDDGRIPVIGITIDENSADVLRLTARLLRHLGRRIGIASGAQVQVDGQRSFPMPGSDRERIGALLLHPRVEVALFESHAAEAMEIGLGCDRVDVAILTSLEESADEVLVSALPLIHAVSREGTAIVSESTPHIDRIVAGCAGQVLLYSVEGEMPRLREHQARGGKVAFCLNEDLVLATGPNAFFLPRKGCATDPAYADDVWLPAVAAAWAAGVPVELLRGILNGTATRLP